ncbi:MAG: DUF3850 domain-containing protein [Lactococcus lactis]|nr:DUF3850 domain-containing protein [Lactococcus lactis]MDN5473935.1 DUF3850 domain-containing protein [Lactococcus lactis]
MTVHELKQDIKCFDDIKSGKKNFVIGKNYRDFEVGDVLVLSAYVPMGGTDTSGYARKTDQWDVCDFKKANKIKAEVTHILSAKDYNLLARNGRNGISAIKEVVKKYFKNMYLTDEYVVLGIEVEK